MPTTWNPSETDAGLSLSNGNLTYSRNTASGKTRALQGHRAGKKYFEIHVDQATSTGSAFGLSKGGADLTTLEAGQRGVLLFTGSGSLYVNGATKTGPGLPVTGSTVRFAVDFSNLQVWININGGNWNGSGTADPATNTGGYDLSAFIGSAVPLFPVAIAWASGNAGTANFGASAFSYAMPSGFTAWDDVSDALAAPYIVASSSAITPGSGRTTIATDIAWAKAGDILVAVIAAVLSPGTISVTGVADSKGLSWTLQANGQIAGLESRDLRIWQALVTSDFTTADTITATWNTGVDDGWIAVFAVRNASGWSADASLPGKNDDFSGSATTPTVTGLTCEADALIIGAAMQAVTSSPAALAAASGYTNIEQPRGTHGARYNYGVVEGKIGALNAENVTATPACPYWFMVVDALLPAGTTLALTASFADDATLTASVTIPIFLTADLIDDRRADGDDHRRMGVDRRIRRRRRADGNGVISAGPAPHSSCRGAELVARRQSWLPISRFTLAISFAAGLPATICRRRPSPAMSRCSTAIRRRREPRSAAHSIQPDASQLHSTPSPTMEPITSSPMRWMSIMAMRTPTSQIWTMSASSIPMRAGTCFAANCCPAAPTRSRRGHPLSS